MKTGISFCIILGWNERGRKAPFFDDMTEYAVFTNNGVILWLNIY